MKLLKLQDKILQTKLHKLGKRKDIKYISNIPVRSTHYYQALEHLLTNIPKTSKILEIGSFVGSFLNVIKLCGYNDVLGIDKEPEFIELSNNLGYKNVCLLNLYKNTLTPNSFDFIFCINFFFNNKKKGHKNELEILNVMKEVHTLLKKGGQVYVKPSCMMPEDKIINIGFEIIKKTENDHPQYVFKKIN